MACKPSLGPKPPTVRSEQSVHHIFLCALGESGLSAADVPPGVERTCEAGIVADLARQRRQPFVSGAKVLKATLVKKYAALMLHQLHRASPAADGSVSPQPGAAAAHKPNVEKQLLKHERDTDQWGSIIDRDREEALKAKLLAKQHREEQIRQQRDTLDRQLEERRLEKEASKRKEVEELRTILQLQESAEIAAKRKVDELKRQQRLRREEANAMSSKLAEEARRRQAEEKEKDRQQALAAAQEAERAKAEDAAKRKDAQAQLLRFVTENEAIILERKRHQERAEKSTAVTGNVPLLPSGDPVRPTQDKQMVSALRNHRRDVAATAYEALQMKLLEQRRMEEDKLVQQQREAVVRDAERARELRTLEEEEKRQYRRGLESQVQWKSEQKRAEGQTDSMMRREVELGVRFGAVEQARLKDVERVTRQRTMEVLKAQLESQKQLRSGNEVTPKIV